ncbi:MAG: prolipoprotein diacylglyceryl transferase family protein [Ornithinimicrobium sp.]
MGQRPRLVRHAPSSPVSVTEFNCSSIDQVDRQSLGVTYWFDAEPTGSPYPVTVHLSGHLKDTTPQGEGRTSFRVTSTVDEVLPGTGQICVTTRIPNLAAGEWEVSAKPVKRAPEGAPPTWVEVAGARLKRGSASGKTAFPPFVRNIAPGVRLGAWPALVTTGFLLALLIQIGLARHLDLPALRLFLLTVTACGLGLIGAKGYYVITHLRQERGTLVTGMSVQGFVITMLSTLIIGASLLDLPLGAVLDTSAPALLFGMAVGRLGCLLGGCCVGRPTTSRWGIWSSDRRLGIKRIPVQLLESALSALLAASALLVVLQLGTAGRGLVLIAALASYILGRQLLFPLRNLPRATKHGRAITFAVAVLVFAGSALSLILM